MDPVEPNIDPILTAGVNSLGSSMTWRMIGDGFTGVATNASYDQWSPARQYSLNHRGARILTETASARLATPMDMPFERLGEGRGYDARTVSWNYPALWSGGRWGIGDIVKYQTAASWALLVQAARDREGWLTSYANMGDRAMGPLPPFGRDKWPAAYVIAKAQADTNALHRLIWTLQHGQVEVHETSAQVSADGKTYPAGSYVVPLRQPFGGYAKALLERQHYPDLHEYPGGPPKRPYDVTAHTLPLLFGVDVSAVMDAEPSMSAGLVRPVTDPTYPSPVNAITRKRIAVFRPSANEPMDEGWTRWVLDVHHVPFTLITEKDVAPGLESRFDAIIVSDQPSAQLSRVLGGNGAAALVSFVEHGGTLLAFNEASNYAIEAMSLPVKNVLAGVRSTEFYAPGSIFAVEVKRDHPMMSGFTAPVPAVWFENGPAFEITDSTAATAVATYPTSGNPLLSGWLLGGEKLRGKAALVDVRRGSGHVLLYGFRPQYRGQPNATFPLIWGALR
jgi:hypothetical protein